MLSRALVFLLIVIAAVTAQARDDAAIQEVTVGKRSEARAEWWGFDEKDSTVAIQAAIDSKAHKVIISNTGKPWNVRTLTLTGDQEIVFEAGTVVQALRGEFKSKNAMLFVARQVNNIKLTGKTGATLRMWKADYQAPPYEKSEWRHALGLYACKNVIISGLTIADTGGDGIYLGAVGEKPCQLVKIQNVRCLNNHRQGISVISAEDLLIEDSAFNETSGTAPQAGIDFEPNSSRERLKNCVVRRCEFNRNASSGVLFALRQLDAGSEPISITISDCRMQGNAGNASHIALRNPAAVRGSIAFANCQFEDSPTRGVIIDSKTVLGAKLTFANCQFNRLAANKVDASPIEISSRGAAGDTLGGIDFQSCTVEDSRDRRPLFYSDVGGLRLKQVNGTLTVKSDKNSTIHELTQKLLDAWFPWSAEVQEFPLFDSKGLAFVSALPKARRPLPAFNAAQRDDAQFLVSVPKGEALKFRVKVRAVGKSKPQAIPVRVVAPSGKVTELTPVPAGEGNYSLNTQEAGAHRVIVAAGQHAVTFHASALAYSAFSLSGSFHFIGSTGLMSFYVPAGTQKFGLTIAGGGGTEQVKATVTDAAGHIAATVDNIGLTRQIALQRSNTDQAEIWTLELSKPTEGVLEDAFVMFNGLPALLASSPNALLCPAAKDQKPPGYYATPTLILIGDSTVASYDTPPSDRPTLTGWGQVLGQFMVRGVTVRDEAISGTSAKSFLASGYWQNVAANPGDYLLIQFGHNDSKRGERFDAPGGTYDELLRGYIHQARGLDMKPVLITSVSRMIFDKDGKIKPTGLAPYVEAMKRVAELEHVPLIDLNSQSQALLEKVGPKVAQTFQASATDQTHFSRPGALAMARLVAEELKKQVPELAPFMALSAQ